MLYIEQVKKLFMQLFAFRKSGIKFKYILSVLSLFSLSVISLMVFFVERTDRLLHNNLEQKLNLVEKNLGVIVKKSLEDSSYSSLNSFVVSTSKQDKEIVSILVLDKNKTIIATSDEEKYPLFYLIEDKFILEKVEQKKEGISQIEGKSLLHHVTFIKYDNPIPVPLEESDIPDVDTNSNAQRAKDINNVESETTDTSDKLDFDINIQGILYISLTTKYLSQEIQNLWMYSGFALLIFLILGFAISYMIASNLSRPLVSLASNVQNIAKGNLNLSVLDDRIQKRNDEIGQLYIDVDKMRLSIKFLTDNLEDKVKQRTRALQVAQEENIRILENMPSGLLTIDEDYQIGSQYSSTTEDIVLRDHINQFNFIELIEPMLGIEHTQLLKKYLLILFNPGINSMFLADINPIKHVEVLLKDPKSDKTIKKCLEFLFFRITVNSNIVGIIISIVDISKVYFLNKQMEEQERVMSSQTKQLYSILNADAQSLTVFMTDATEDLKKLNLILGKEEPNKMDMKEFYRIVHSIKGNASVLDLELLSSIAHTAEDQIDKIRKAKAVSPKQLSHLHTSIHDLENSIQNTRDLIEKLNTFKTDITSKQSLGIVVLHAMDDMAKRLADLLGCNINFSYTDFDSTCINHANRRVIQDSFIQLLRNSLAHGIESEEEREKAGKPAVGHITLSTEKKVDRIWLIYQDDGRGLNISKLKKKALNLNLGSQQEIDNWDHEQLVNLIFQPNFSTADKVSMHSGRGVGMDIIKANFQTLQATITVNFEEGRYFRIAFGLPLVNHVSS